MKIYRIEVFTFKELGYTYIDPVNEILSLEEEDALMDCEELTLKGTRKICLMNKQKKTANILGDVLLLIIDEKVKNILKKYASATISFIPMKVEKYDYWLLNIIGYLDCFDYKNSEYTTFRNGNPDKIKQVVFREDLIPETAIFRLKEKSSALFVTEKLKNLLEAAEVTGIRFNEDMNLTVGF